MSWPAARIASTWPSGMPSIQVVAMTRLEVRLQSTFGTTKPASLASSRAMFSAISEVALASIRRSHSRASERPSVATVACGFRRREEGTSVSISQAARAKARMSRSSRASMPGRKILTATSSDAPSGRARWTCATEAAATGASNRSKSRSSGAPSSASSTAIASACGKGGRRSRKVSSSAATSAPTRSGRVARNWPSLI